MFQDEYKDNNPDTSKSSEQPKTDNEAENQPSIEKHKPSTSVNLIDTSCLESEQASGNTGILSDLAGLRLDGGDMPANFGSFMPSQLLQVREKYFI